MVDHLFETLANKYRRRLLVALVERDPGDEIPIPEAVHEGERELEKLRTEMTQIHLPKMEDAGFIRWDRDTHMITRGPQFDEIAPLVQLLLDNADELPDEWL